MKKLIGLSTFALAIGGVAASAPAVAQERILFNCFFPPQHYVCREYVPEIAKRVDKATDGRVKITIPPKSVAAPPDQYDAVVNGVADGALQFNAFISNKVAGMQLSLLPFVGGEASIPTTIALWRTYEKYFADKKEYEGVVLLAIHASNGAEFFSLNDQPIETVDDIKSRKMWALPGVTANLMKAAGSSVVSGPAVQMLEIISKGVVDGYTGVPINSVEDFKLTGYTKSVTIFKRKVFQPTFSYFISEKKWAKISPADQSAIKKTLGEDVSRFLSARQDEIQDGLKKKVFAAGVKRVVGSDAELAKLEALGQPAIDTWIKRVGDMGLDGKAIIAFYRGIIEEEAAKLPKE